eukprot:g34686.t1
MSSVLNSMIHGSDPSSYATAGGNVSPSYEGNWRCGCTIVYRPEAIHTVPSALSKSYSAYPAIYNHLVAQRNTLLACWHVNTPEVNVIYQCVQSNKQ